MAKKQLKKDAVSLQGFDVQAYKQTEAYTQAIDALYNKAILDFAQLAIRTNIDPAKAFSFSDYPGANAAAQQIVNTLASRMQSVITTGTRKQWLYACQKNDEFLAHIMSTSRVPKKTLAKMQDRNLEALKTFQSRKVNGMDLSKRVWGYAGQMKDNMEMGIDVGIGEGKSAAKLARELRQNLNDPDNLFRRVRDKNGALHMSKNAKAFHPGQGVYRSSVKNAQRLTRSEINMAYRQSDILRWQQLDFVVGFEVKVSERHKEWVKEWKKQNKGKTEICDQLAGRYPKSFIFKGWHPQCYSNDTEVMTNNGWKLFKDLLSDDLIMSLNPETRHPEYVKYVNSVEYHKEGEMIRFSNRTLDLLVTSDHKMVYIKKSDGEIVDDKLAADYTKCMGGLYRSSEYESIGIESIAIGKHILDFNLFTEFMAYYLSEGSLSWTRNNQLFVAQSKEKHPKTYANIENLLSKLPFKYTAGKIGFYIRDIDLYGYLKRFGKSKDKHIPIEIKNAAPEQIHIFLDAYVACDGHSRKCKSFMGSHGNTFNSDKEERVFFSSSDQMAADIGELILKIGRRPSYSIDKIEGVSQQHRNGIYVGNKDLWRVRECYGKTATVFNKELVPYSGSVYDIELEKNHILYVRRNGKCVWGSNCLCHVIPIMMDRDEFNTDELNGLRAAFRGEEYDKFTSRNTVTDVPNGMKDWVATNKEASANWGSQPYFVKDNFKGGKIQGGLKIANIEQKIVKQPIDQPTPKVEPIRPAKIDPYVNVKTAEAEISRNKSFETLLAFDESGVEAFRKRGQKYSVSMTDEEVAMFKDKIITHNHPRGWKAPENSIGRIGSSFSPADISLAIKANASEIRAAGPVYTFIMKRPSKGWGMSPEQFRTRVKSIEKDVASDMQTVIYRSKIADADIARANILHYHLIWKRFCEKYGIEYTKIRTQQ